ncbi:MAG TPA: NAD-dependent epimerase/dehydratase family protein [Gemmatimonadaceae bacterium]|nr:NAD-dependent epimerase/dehydratase family protein [Gemmatimonadaceae bacterium]
MRILVTGGTGVVGTGTVTELLTRGHEVVLLSRHANADARQWPTGVVPRQGDVANAASIRGAADDCDVVLHMVGIVDETDDATFAGVNVGGTANMLAETERAKVKRFIFVSSLGASEGKSAYHASKREAESLVRRFHGQWVIARPGNVYGPGDEQISLLLRMVRSPSPVIPRIGDGDQPIQPVWWEDVAIALVNIVERTDLGGRELDIAGPELTSQNDLIARFSRITGREVHGVSVPDFLATLGSKMVSLVGWDMSFNEQQVTMLHEGNAIPAGGVNALDTVLRVTPTSLDEGLRKLADAQAEQLPSEGIGTLNRKRFWADISACPHGPADLFALFRTHFNELTPVFVEAAPEPGTTDLIDEGETITLALPMRGHVQVRVAELSSTHATLLTLEGHPLAGAVRFRCDRVNGVVRFQIEVFDRPANLLDLVAMRTLGDRLQSHTWEEVVQGIIERSGGSALDGVQHSSASLDEAEAKEIEVWLAEVVLRRKREENAEKISAGR